MTGVKPWSLVSAYPYQSRGVYLFSSICQSIVHNIIVKMKQGTLINTTQWIFHCYFIDKGREKVGIYRRLIHLFGVVI